MPVERDGEDDPGAKRKEMTAGVGESLGHARDLIYPPGSARIRSLLPYIVVPAYS
jgi:hypothetical protein